ncbi:MULTISPECIES: endonuclease III domain-containing protein [Deinococcus]|uniref:Endonuclease III domain-containing protein n=1 Tax=Deinococcus rufus TaxID=2136097 RepID=A0ABV7Z9E6_9DEIO|nr:endonuclease III [Deinococcus sp. AB2017081]WQE96209.1 endonuclease III [Deinococcus sp. AB2017081]
MTAESVLNVARPDVERAELLVWLKDTLRAEYGERGLDSRREPMHELISTILSQRTTHADEEAAYQELRELGDWDAIIAAPTEQVAHAIRRSQYPESKAPRIQQTLVALRDSPGGYSLEFLRDMPVKDALKFLTDLPGVGIKTASLVLLFNYARPVFPVDTHVHRVTTRVGAIPKMGEQAAHRALLKLLPADPPFLYELHVNLLRHGQRVCSWTAPKCGVCVLRERCDAYATYGGKVPSWKA